MNYTSTFRPAITSPRFTAFLVSVFLLTITLSSYSQQPQLTLADLLIGLRSKKANIVDRNAILAEAVRQRGVTFSLSADIEKELTATGASNDLLAAIREKSPTAVAVPTPAPVPVSTPVPTPTPPDFSFYQTRADSNLRKGEFALALADYDRAVELKADDAIAFMNRGRAHYNLKAFDKASADYDKAIELDPKGSKAFYNRGVLFERLGNLDKAIADYKVAVDLDATNEPAREALKKLLDDQRAKPVEPPPTVAAVPAKVPETEPVKAPEFMNLGNLTASNAIRMATPVYPSIAQKSNIEGRVVVEVQIDDTGSVVSAKATSGPQLLRGSAEDAARRSKFKPAMFGTAAIKAIGLITYNFTLRAVR